MIKRLLTAFLVSALVLVATCQTPVIVMAQAQGEALYFTLMHTNDEHSALLPSPLTDYDPAGGDPTVGGFARLAQAVRQIRDVKQATSEPTLLISAGDFLGGSPYAWLALEGYAAELELMIAMGYDLIAIGNHEYDFGPEWLARYLVAAGYPSASEKTVLLATNTEPPDGHPLHDLGIKRTHLITLANGIKVGFFSIIGVDAVDVAPLSAPVMFSEQIGAARSAVDSLVAAGANVIIAVNHAGLDEDEDLARQVPGIDVIISGHCHTALSEPKIVNGTIIAQTGSSLNNLGVLELVYDAASGNLGLRNTTTGQPYLVPLSSAVGEEASFSARIDQYTEKLDFMVSELTDGRFTSIAEVVVHSDFVVTNKPSYSETPFGNFVADAMRVVGEQATGTKVDFAFQADGVIRGSLLPGTTVAAKGNVALLDLLDLVSLGSGPDERPGYPLVAFYFTGEEVRRVLEISLLLSELLGDSYFLQVSGLRMTYDPALAVLARIPGKGTPIPSTRAVISAARFVGEGLQTGDQYEPLKRKDEQLYHVVSDYYLAAFLPMVGDLLPSLGLVMKDAAGNPITPEEAIVYRGGHELKVWQTVAEYASMQPPNSAGQPSVAGYYATTAARQVVRTIWPVLVALLFVVSILIISMITFFRRRRKRRWRYTYSARR